MSRIDEIEKYCRSSLVAGPDSKSEDTLWLIACVQKLEAGLINIRDLQTFNRSFRVARIFAIDALAAREAVDAPVGDEKFERMMRDGGWERAGEAG